MKGPPSTLSVMTQAHALNSAEANAVTSYAEEVGALDLYDQYGKLLARIALAGDHHSLAIDLAHVVPQLLAYPCRAVILMHSHPSGRAEPSESDFLATRAFAGLLRLLGIALHDHLILGGETRFSFRAAGLL